MKDLELPGVPISSCHLYHPKAVVPFEVSSSSACLRVRGKHSLNIKATSRATFWLWTLKGGGQMGPLNTAISFLGFRLWQNNQRYVHRKYAQGVHLIILHSSEKLETI